MEEKGIWWKRIINWKNAKYVISSVVSSILEFAVFFLMTSIIWKDAKEIILIATIVGRTLGTTLCFFLNKYWCFQVYNRTLIQSIEYAILFVIKLYLSYFFVNMIVDRFAINPTLIKLPIDITLFFVGYLVQNFIIFRKPKEKAE
ncbi:MAG: GtrA family protein [Bacilli bacterium]|nr:GtrA family protein [Bacilli bacterium]